MNKKQLTYKPIFWLLFSCASIGGLIFSYTYFSKALPIVNLNVQMNRSEALKKANIIANKYNLGPKNFRQAITFSSDKQTQMFIELEAGGKERFNKILKEKKYEPYTWQIRHFKESTKHELLIIFTPEGKPYGFKEHISEKKPGVTITTQEAQKIAALNAQKEWAIQLQEYKLIEASKNIPASGRTDHTFVYEKQNETIGQGRYRIRLVISGNVLTELIQFIKIPDDFQSRFQEMRTANKTIAMASGILMFLLYILGGCLIGLFFLLQSRSLLWKKSFFWGVILGFLQFISSINNIPNAWMHYDTAVPAKSFLFSYLLQSTITAFVFCFFSSLIFSIAEGLTRKAFKNHIQLWQIWSPKNASSYEVLGRTIGGYLIVGIQLALVIATYLFATAFLGWWSPSDILISPNILATYLPWLSPFSAALSAGFIEECLFRAIPLAGAALLGKKYGHTTLWITIAFILQALIFGGAHATYATQPSYARLIELIIPSFLFGGMYLLYGLLPAILSHTIFDLTLMSLPLFISSGTEGKINQIIVIFLALIPFIIIFIARLKTKLFKSLNINSYNAAWKPPVLIKKNIPKKTEPIFTKKISAKTKKITIIVGLFSLFIWGLLTTFQQESPKLLISKSKAISLAQKELEKRNITLDKTWQTLPMLIGNYTTHPIHTMQHQFIWQSDKSLYRSLIGSYLAPSRWVIRFVTFSGTISERSEEYLVIITEHGTVFRFIHKIPELKSGKHLNEKKAREIAHNYLAQSIKIQPNQVQEISATKTKKPNRTDWLFTFFNPTVYTLQEGKAQIKIQISGNEITDSNYDIHVPEIWQRENRKKQNMMGIIKILSMIFLFGLFLIALFKRKRYTFSIPTAIISFVVYSFILTFSFFNTWTTIIANINTSEPFGQQLFFILAALSIGMIIQVGILALFSGFTYSYKSTKLTIKKFKIFIVGLCLGTTVIALNSLWQAFFPPIKPLWATFELLATRLPLIASINNAILGIITYTTINLILLGALDFISNRFKNNKTILIPLFLIIGIAFNGIFDFAGIGQWLLSGSILGIILFIIYYFIIRFDHSIIVSILGAIFALKYIQQALFDAYPLAWLGNIFAAITVILVALFLFLRVTSKKNFIK